MARKKKQTAPSRKKQNTANVAGEVTGILLLALALLLAVFIYFSYEAPLAKWSRVAVFGLFGIGGYLIPLLFAGLGILCIVNVEVRRRNVMLAGGFFWLMLSFVELCVSRVYAADAVGYFSYLGHCFSNSTKLSGGGILGGILSYPAERLLGKVGGLILLGAGMLVLAMLITHFSIRDTATTLGAKIKNASSAAALARQERAQRQVHSIKESVRDVDTLYEEEFSEIAPEQQKDEEIRRENIRREREAEEQKQREMLLERRQKEAELEKRKREEEQRHTDRSVHSAAAKQEEDLQLLHHEFSKTFPAADTTEAKQIQLYPAETSKEKYFKHAGKLRPKRGLRRKGNSNQLIVPPKVKDPLQQQLAEDYYINTGLRPKQQAVHTETEKEKVTQKAASEETFKDRYYFGDEDEKNVPVDEQLAEEKSNADSDEQQICDQKVAEEVVTEQPVSTAEETAVQEVLPEEQKAPEEKVYQLPNRMDLLEDAPRNEYGKRMEKENLSKALILEQALRSFNIDIKVNNIVTGPTVTRYELLPAPGVKVSKILSLSNDIALNLAAPSVRIEAPIPGKAAIGIEVPNREVAMVKIKELLDTEEFRKHKSRLYFALGKDITGKNIYGDLAKMPHLLVAGTTGSGKSVCINSIIMSILYRSSPEEVNLLMVDPKVVEMKRFNGIPHMKTAVVTDPKKATSMLNWVVNEMLKRYNDFANANVKEIDSYNLWLRQQGEKIMPKLVVVIDELADLMMASKHEVEDAICRIAQLGRAAGIHLVVATQTPRADVITGMIKTNISSRIALAVSSGLDSRIILDMNGAEDLLGNGDMLFMPIGQSKPIRLQGCYISDAENERVIDFLKSSAYEEQNDIELEKQLEAGVAPTNASAGSEENTPADGFDDELIPAAIKLALEYEQLSSSMLMRRLKVGYARAARLVDQLELMEIVSPADGNKPRQLLITQEDYRRMFEKKDM